MIHQYKSNGYNIVMDINSGAIHVVDDVVYDIIELYEGHEKSEIMDMLASKYPKEDMEEAFEEIETLIKEESLFTEDIYKDYIIDLDKRMAFQGDEDLNLTTLEFDLLYMFVTNKEKSFSRDDILNNIWGENYFGTDRVVDDLIRRLRKKMPLLDINTIYGYGYRLL